MAEMLRVYQGGKAEKEATSALGNISAERNKAITDALRGFSTNMAGAPEQRTEVPSQMFVADDAGGGEMAMGTNTQVTPAVAPNPMAAYQALMASPDAAMRTAAMTGMGRIPELEAKKQELQETRDFRRDEAERARQAKAEQAERDALIEDRRIKENNENRRQLVQLQASLRPERNVTVMGPNGEPVTMPQSQAQGMPLYNPQAASALQKSKTKSEARDQLSGVVQQLNNSYTKLEQGGGITSTGQGPLANIRAAAGSSGIGQAISGALGTENQRQRQEIEQTRPLLLNLIKEATGMSAQQMNSNAEMNLYLKAATDPTLSVEANRSALANLDKMFGLGLAQRPNEGGATPPAATAGGRSPQDAAALQWAQQNPNDPRSRAIMQRLGGQ
jgi:hypothetical protein